MRRNNKKIKEISCAVTGVLFIGICVVIICVAKYKGEHRYLTYEELPLDTIIFQVKMSTGDYYTEVWEYDVCGRRYFSKYIQNNPYDQATEKMISREVEENYIAKAEIQSMYESLLQVDNCTEYEKMSHMITLDMSSSIYAGIKYCVNGEIEYVYVGRGQGERITDRLKDLNAQEICDWLLGL